MSVFKHTQTETIIPANILVHLTCPRHWHSVLTLYNIRWKYWHSKIFYNNSDILQHSTTIQKLYNIRQRHGHSTKFDTCNILQHSTTKLTFHNIRQQTDILQQSTTILIFYNISSTTLIFYNIWQQYWRSTTFYWQSAPFYKTSDILQHSTSILTLYNILYFAFYTQVEKFWRCMIVHSS